VSAAPVPVAATAPVAQAAPAPALPVAPAAPAVAAPPAPEAPTVTENKPASSKPTRPVADEPLPEEVRDALEEAEKALRAEDSEEAIRLARGTLSTLKTSASYSVMIRAYCRQRDMGGAKAKWREGQKWLSSKDRGQVKQYCKPYEIEF
jgi:pentatricopeptide repeat protein